MTRTHHHLLRRTITSASLVLLSLASAGLGAGTTWSADLRTFNGTLSPFIYLKPLQPLRSVPFQDADRRIVEFDRFRGRVVLVNLWATWCAPCVAEMPALDRLQGRLGGDRFTVVAIALDAEGLAPVAAFFRRHNLTHLDLYLDPEHRTIRSDAGNRQSAAFPLYQLPMTYLLDEQGRAIGYLKGPADWDSPQAVRFLGFFAQSGGR